MNIGDKCYIVINSEIIPGRIVHMIKEEDDIYYDVVERKSNPFTYFHIKSNRISYTPERAWEILFDEVVSKRESLIDHLHYMEDNEDDHY